MYDSCPLPYEVKFVIEDSWIFEFRFCYICAYFLFRFLQMEKSFDLGALLLIHEKKHKNKPVQFVSVAGGVKKRLESNIRHRKSTRFSVFDKIRNLPRCESPVHIPQPQKKIEHRKMQLEKWKEEKEKKKKEALLQKKKPFLTGIPHNPLKSVFPPSKPMPSTSGRVTRSQSAKNNLNNAKKNFKIENKPKSYVQSFAPKNAVFHPPVLKNLVNLPMTDMKYDIITKTVKGKASKQLELKASRNQLQTNKDQTTIKKGPISIHLTSQSSSSVDSSEDNPPISKKTVRDKASKHLEPRVLRNKLQSNKDQTTIKKGPTSVHSTSQSSSSVDSNKNDTPISKLITPRKSRQGKQKMVTPKNVPKSESSSEEKLRSPKLIDIAMTPEQISEIAKKISPCVTLSRGKDNARKEIKKKIKEGLLDDDLCEMDSVEHFRRQLDSEISRMTEMCVAWDKILNQLVLPESVQEAVLCAVGQARLLMSQKLQQFASLLSRCENPAPNTALVTPTDLHGFWDMVYMQIENVDMRFCKLEELRARDWSEEPVLPSRPDIAPAPRLDGPSVRPAARPATRPAARPAATSRLKDLIAAARRAKQAPAPEPSSAESKTLDMGFFSIQSPVKSPLPATPTRPSLLKAVLSNETEKSANRKCASFAMLRASLIGRQVESEDSAEEEPNLITFTPVDLAATPARSILKNKPSTRKSSKKSIKVVLFDESDSDLQNNSISIEKPACDMEDKILDIGKKETNHKTDSPISYSDVENEMEKENKVRRKSKLTRQDAIENRSPVLTRSRRKSMQTPSEHSEKSSSRKQKILKEVVYRDDEDVQTPKRSSRKSRNREVM